MIAQKRLLELGIRIFQKPIIMSRGGRVQDGWAGSRPKSNKSRRIANTRPSEPSITFVENSHVPHTPPTFSSSVNLLVACKEQRKKAADSVVGFNFRLERIKTLSKTSEVAKNSGGIIYWMSRDGRVQDNWAFLYAQKLALEHKLPLHVCFCLVPKFLDATLRHFKFMLAGLEEVSRECDELNIPFHLLRGDAGSAIPIFVRTHQIGGVVCDQSPMRVPSKWTASVAKQLDPSVLFCQVDAHNLVPVWLASDRHEVGPSTLRPKINGLLRGFLTEFPPIVVHPYKSELQAEKIDWPAVVASLKVDETVDAVEMYKPGATAAFEMLQSFLEKRLATYADIRNIPTDDGSSNLSPWFHFGQLSVQRAIIEVEKFRGQHLKSVNKFCDEAIVWRELSDNYVYYNPNYDTLSGAPEWGKRTLNEHRHDRREYVYTLQEFDDAVTHDDLWNASQIQMRREGKMHGFLRMYWAKKILEWSESPSRAVEIAIYLNDRYNIDGRDPNGYAGIMWSMCGLHDRPFDERAIYGKVRHMTYAGCKHKFNMKEFINRYGAKAHFKK